MVFHRNRYCDDWIEASGSLKKDLIWLPHRGKKQNSQSEVSLDELQTAVHIDVALQLNHLPLVWRVNQAFMEWRLLH